MNSSQPIDRRRALAAIGALSLAGCLGRAEEAVRPDNASGADNSAQADEPESGPPSDTTELDINGITKDPNGDAPIVTGEALHMAHAVDDLREAALSGGPGVDGIPAVDNPQFEPIADSNLGADKPVFGVVRDGEAKAYSQQVLVWHEIVNDEIAGDPITVTYCPLTGTAQGFDRGETTFGVSGQLINSNLLMFDRGTGTLWPQMLAQGIEGPLLGKQLSEFRLVWTTVGRWRDRYPDSEIITNDTGYQRRYGDDPYGGYTPQSGYYETDRTMFEPLAESDAAHPKSVVIGARTPTGAIAVDKERLLEERILSGTIGNERYVAVADPGLQTGYVYHDPDGATIEPDGDGYLVDGETVQPESLPLDRTIAYDAMFFAWYGYYPDATYVN
ncbi:DUF3179 domain-containing protein [Halalkalirubrum salinum]|uniref:DUF3179 domain-containing protein n=1 Tax=Halalkalirubrum salinum TaxID=2563889 RepID=UPI0010FB9B72|nr:DUF3179 domain-containing protein [Halalkalirubrum salinum]